MLERQKGWSAELISLKEQEADLQLSIAQETQDNRIAIAQIGLQAAAGIVNALATMTSAKMNAELAAAGDNEEEKVRIRKEGAKKQKQISLVQAMINVAQGITSALTLPPPLSFIMAGITAAAGAIQVGAIAAQKFADGGVSQGGMAMVGERGKELVSLPMGSRVLSHPDTMKAVSGASNGRMVVIPDVILRGEDIYLSFKEAERKLTNTRG
jgi:hypothetical protein